ncbi:hypothetical protein [Shewanella colwelliana]|uniref:hypothetical protein n=1 Tax=Shewanella TaxID=22 RepID=UPI0022AF4395|nr:hypothetical protein [Shewanella colwelliana]MCZ4337622.1 hypothetical protein [Shewanella colwelliana]
MNDIPEFRPFRLVIQTVTPVIITEFAPCLDALIYAGLSQVYPGNSNGELLERMKSILLFDEDIQVFHASSLRFVVTPDQGITAKANYRVDCIRGKLESSLFKPNGSKNKYKAVTTAGGPTKTRMSYRAAYSSAMYVFDGVGYPDKIRTLLLNAFVGIGYDAFNVGSGEIKHIDIIDLEDDLSLHHAGQVRRNLPVSFCKTHQLEGRDSVSALTPPYYDHLKAEPARSPNRIDAIPSNRLFDAI